MRILLLGGTAEAGRLARALAEAGIDAVYSYAGRTDAPAGQPVPVRTGGFGGPEGLAGFLTEGGFTHLVDATHPFAAQMTRQAAEVCDRLGLPFLRIDRPAWVAGPGDRWSHVADLAGAAAALPSAPATVFLAIGRQGIGAFASRPEHRYLLRLVDPPEGPLPLPRCTVILGRGPFDAAADRALMEAEGVAVVVAKNAGGGGAEAKLRAARALDLPVIMIDRPVLPALPAVTGPEEAMAWLHGADLGV